MQPKTDQYEICTRLGMSTVLSCVKQRSHSCNFLLVYTARV